MIVSDKVHALFAMAFSQFGQEYGDAEKSKIVVVDDVATLTFDASEYEESTIGALCGTFSLQTSASQPKRLTISARSTITHSSIDESRVKDYARRL